MAGGVFCIEGQWHRNLADRSSVRPILELLEQRGEIRFTHKGVAVPEALDHYLDRWSLARHSAFNVGYLAMHGDRGLLYLTDQNAIDLERLAEPVLNKLNGRRLFFGSCGFMSVQDDRLIDFLAKTGAALACGYTHDVDWIESAAFETALLGVLANSVHVNGVERRMATPKWVHLAAHLGFRIVYPDGGVWRAVDEV